MLSIALPTVGAALAVAFYNSFAPSSPISDDQIRSDGGKVLHVGNRSMEYFEFGAIEEEAKFSILALHGAMTTGKLWKDHDQWGKENKVRIIAPSLPGWGLSTAVYENKKLAGTPLQWAENDALSLLEYLRFSPERRIHVVGASLGSIYAAALAGSPKTSPLIANTMLYVAFAPPSEQHDPLAGSQLRMFSQMHTMPTLARLFEKFVMLPLLRRTLPEDPKRSLRDQWEGLWMCTDNIYAKWTFPYRELSQIGTTGQKRKVLVISGSDDVMAPPANQKLLQREVVGCELIEYKGGHDDGVKKPEMMQEHFKLLLQ